MWKERYRKANEEIPLNEELLGALLETAEKTHNDKRHYVFRFGTVAAAAMIGIGIFSYSYFSKEGENLSEPMAQVTQPKAKIVEEIRTEPSLNETPETEPQKVIPQPVIIVATEESVVEIPEPSDEENEDLANLPATASALMPRTIPTGEQPEETELPISEEIAESDVEEETTPPVDEDAITDTETETEDETVQTDQESPTPTPTPEIELSESES